MTSQGLNRWIVQFFIADLILCGLSYGLYLINQGFIWIFIASLIILVWLAVAGVCSFIELIVEGEADRGQSTGSVERKV